MEIDRKKASMLFALTLLITSLLLANMHVSTSEIVPEFMHLHGPPLTPIHMNSEMTLTPIHMHSRKPYMESITSPICTDWHELYPNYCTDWHLTSWEDNDLSSDLSPNDQIDMTNTEEETKWYHVDRMTVTLNLSWPYPKPDPPAEEKIIWFKQVPPQGPDPPPPPHDPYKIIWFMQILEPGMPSGYEEPVDEIRPCKYYRVMDTDPYEPCFVPPACSWWHVFYPETLYCIYFHVDWSEVIVDPTDPTGETLLHDFHVDIVLPEWRQEPFPPVDWVQAEWIPPLDPIDKVEPCKWYRVIDSDPYQPGFTPPPCSWWHIFFPPDLYCISFHVDKTANGMFHIDRVLPEPISLIDPVDRAEADWTQFKRIFVELKDPEWDPSYPVGTYWHEVSPTYSNVYLCTGWLDTNRNGIVDYCDELYFVDESGITTTIWHVDGVNNDIILREKIIDPTCTFWHEIYPYYCRWHHLTSWEDTGWPEGQLSPSDQIDMLDESKVTRWYHVDRVTLALNVTYAQDPTMWMKIELKTFEFEEMYNALKHPIGTLWHEVYPKYSNVYELDWDWWESDNCNGVLDVCDYILLRDISGDIWELWHVEDICYDLILNEKIADPTGTWWHELYPVFCNEYQITGWEDNDDRVLSPCDIVDLHPMGMRGYHVENVTLTLDVTIIEYPTEHYYFELVSSFEDMYRAKTEPIGTYWTMVWPEYWYGESIPLIDWIDNCNGVLDYCDTIDLGGTLCHVEGLSVDIVVKKEPTFYWKESYPEYAPSGLPDFDQNQFPLGIEGWCGPCAVGNSLWWMDSRFHPSNLITAYLGAVSEHDPSNVPPFVSHLAYLMDTDGQRTVPGGGPPHSGTNVFDMEAGIAQYLSWTGVNPLGDCNGDGTVDNLDKWIVGNATGSTPGAPNWNMAADIWPVTTGWPNQIAVDNNVDFNDVNLVANNMGKNGTFYEHTVKSPDFYYIEEEVEKCQDVVLLLGFWYYDGVDWYREKGHYVTVAGVDSLNQLIAICDPDKDAFENGLIPNGRIPVPHKPHPGDPTVHNNASLVSQDIYQVIYDPCPGGNWSILGYPGWEGWHVQIEYAVITSPLGVHDVAAIDVTPIKTVVGQGYNDKINVTVANEGDFTETFNVTAYANTTEIGTKEVTLTSGNSTTITLIWSTTGVAKGNYTISATAVLLGDNDPGDNTLTDGWVVVTIPGDVDGDFDVDIYDVVMITSIYGSKQGDTLYNPNMDLWWDGVINIYDVVVCTSNYGQKDP